ncbi:MAG: hypothetical protein ACYTAF_14605 [Planctomycetota bacterium]|jgi:type II secretory pathway component PulK
MTRLSRSERGAVGLLLVMVLFVIVFLLGAAAVAWHWTAKTAQYSHEREYALHAARGGVRLAAAKLSADPAFRDAIERTDARGALRVAVEEGVIRSTYALERASGEPLVRTVEVRWSRTDGMRLHDWSEE